MNGRIRRVIWHLRMALRILEAPEVEEVPPEVILTFPRREVPRIVDLLEEQAGLIKRLCFLSTKILARVDRTLKSACPGCDRDLVLRVRDGDLVLECYNPDIAEHRRRGITATVWKLEPINAIP